MQTHKDLVVWQQSIDLAETVYLYTRQFPKEETFAMVSQMRRSATSIPMNVAEGYARYYYKETLHFLYIAVGSAAELDTQVIICKRIGYLDDSQAFFLEQQITSIRKMLNALIKSLKNKMNNGIDPNH
ncbi:MAG: four helix bundle protein [Bacteroidaceae bacterium]|nr:four helix bundle protein [Prevotellaceae bacterium]MDY5632059.1 four helix bundle protein [Bacteroidaceae bacterium]